jgi:hypothetical protein
VDEERTTLSDDEILGRGSVRALETDSDGTDTTDADGTDADGTDMDDSDADSDGTDPS